MAKPARSLDVIHRLRRRVSRRPAPSRGVLLIAAGGLGDTVLFSKVAPRFAELAKPGETVTVLLRRDGAQTAFCLPPGFHVTTVDFQRFDRDPLYRWTTLERLFKGNYRVLVGTDFLRHPHLDEAMAEATAAPETWAMIARPWPKHQATLDRNRRIYTRLFDSGGTRRDKVVRWNDFANWLLGRQLPPPRIFSGQDATDCEGRANSFEVLVQPFSAVKAKQVGTACYEALFRALPDHFTITITGTEKDLSDHPEFKKLLDYQNVRFDFSTFEEISPRLAAAALVISVDTAMMHLAVTLGAPTLCLASAAYVGEIVPYDDRVRPENVTFLYHSMPCEGCLGNCSRQLINGRFPCVDALEPERIVSHALERLQSSSSARS